MSLKEELMMNYREMIRLKVSLGFSPDTYAFYIKEFIDYCAENHSSATEVTKDMIDGWLLARPFSKNATRSRALSNLRTFIKYLNSLGMKSYMPDREYSLPAERYQPYVFTDDELPALFDAFDSMKPCHEAPKRELIVPVLFRMMYCCGMRPSEPLHLRIKDVDLANGEIYIRQSKMSKDRHILMSEELTELCWKYDVMMGTRQWFFQKWDGGPFPTYWMTNQFRIGWKNSGLGKRGNPRPYDLRHCFATRTLMRWVDEKRDVMALLPYLSTYMGHKSFKHTLYYMHLLPERLRTTAGIDWGKLDSIYSKGGTDDED